MIFDDSAGESQSIKLRADGEVPSRLRVLQVFVADVVVSRHRSKRSAPTRREGGPPVGNIGGCADPKFTRPLRSADHQLLARPPPRRDVRDTDFPACDGQGVGRLRLRLIAALGSILSRLITVKQDQVKMLSWRNSNPAVGGVIGTAPRCALGSVWKEPTRRETETILRRIPSREVISVCQSWHRGCRYIFGPPSDSTGCRYSGSLRVRSSSHTGLPWMSPNPRSRCWPENCKTP
jgi:hypothetical protein